MLKRAIVKSTVKERWKETGKTCGEKEQEIFILKESKKREIFNCVPFVWGVSDLFFNASL